LLEKFEDIKSVAVNLRKTTTMAKQKENYLQKKLHREDLLSTMNPTKNQGLPAPLVAPIMLLLLQTR
jgi:hypothetical protein